MNRRRFLRRSAAGLALGLAPPVSAAPTRPRLTFYGATRQVSGSCHLLETSRGLFLVDCGSFFPDL